MKKQRQEFCGSSTRGGVQEGTKFAGGGKTCSQVRSIGGQVASRSGSPASALLLVLMAIAHSTSLSYIVEVEQWASVVCYTRVEIKRWVKYWLNVLQCSTAVLRRWARIHVDSHHGCCFSSVPLVARATTKRRHRITGGSCDTRVGLESEIHEQIAVIDCEMAISKPSRLTKDW